MTLAVDEIKKLSYPDFVGLMKQENTPPGGHNTVISWIHRASIDDKSKVFDLACSTGFSSRTASLLTGCSGVGIDISELAIQSANELASSNNLEDKLDFVVMDATKLNGLSGFSHVLGGCNFAFIQDRERALEEVYNLLDNDGKLCVSNFHYESVPTTGMLDRVESVLGWRPSKDWSDKYWLEFFSSKFELIHEEVKDIMPENVDDLTERLKTSLFNPNNERFRHFDDDQKVAFFERLLNMRIILNEHRKYQGYSIQVWRKK